MASNGLQSGLQSATSQATTAEAAKSGTDNASSGVNQQQQVIMARMFSAFLSNMMSVASENANNG